MTSVTLSAQQITHRLQALLPQFTDVNWCEQTGSTNADLLGATPTPMGHSALRGAFVQTAGRGRAGRTWVNTRGQTLMFSVGFQTALMAPELNGLSIALGVGACQALTKVLPSGTASHAITLKWPNDLMVNDRKLAGILVETQISRQRIRVVAGIGINLSQADRLSQQLSRPIAAWGDLAPVHDDAVVEMVSSIAQAWHAIVTHYHDDGLTRYRTAFQSLDYLLDQPIDVVQNGQTTAQGIARGIDRTGALRVQLPPSPQNTMARSPRFALVHVGDISIRKTVQAGSTQST